MLQICLFRKNYLHEVNAEKVKNLICIKRVYDKTDTLTYGWI